MRSTRRPKVMLTVARVDGNRPLHFHESVMLNRVMTLHDQPNRDRLVYACLECACIGEAPTQYDRDQHVADKVAHGESFCHDGRTVTFKTEEV